MAGIGFFMLEVDWKIMVRSVTRRGLLRASGAAMGSLSVVGVGSASKTGTKVTGDSSVQPEPIPPVELDGNRIETVSPSTIPETAAGVRAGSKLQIIHPDGFTGGCTANFIWREVDDEKSEEELDLFIGTAGHCILQRSGAEASENAARDGEESIDVSDFTARIDVDGRFGSVLGITLDNGDFEEIYVELGEVTYARFGDPDGDGEVGHDFALIEIPDELRGSIDPSIPTFGGPTGIARDPVPEGETVHLYGFGTGYGEVYATSGRSGTSLGDEHIFSNSEWLYGIPMSAGDSGAPLVASEPGLENIEGNAAIGVATHLFPPQIGAVAQGTPVTRCIEMVQEDPIGLEIGLIRTCDL